MHQKFYSSHTLFIMCTMSHYNIPITIREQRRGIKRIKTEKDPGNQAKVLSRLH